ncbi:extracellular matrix-binding protein ebh isoform X2 [Bactrocera tryoni]|uniref:extracellular matrix-binding protein ebh isoform X2 n=1 Tax=Bactrocera tryoni TaxID=59916 RepID=UPI001A9597E9|nr:extracellular matrix-binding protein ebh isoform X2 [Bactrocera tryoni]XP_039948064.1 extracellular matrix-binding protein ebh isoform X2 [Bactrocera tryoni]
MVCILHGYYNVHPKMRFSLSPPPSSKSASVITSPTNMQANYAQSNYNEPRASGVGARSDDDISPAKATPAAAAATVAAAPAKHDVDDEAASDYNQWLHAMKLVARLPGGMPPEFRCKLWLSLADKYLKSKNVDWAKEEEKCFCEKWREDDEELGIQIVKDLHRTGSNLCTGPAGSINQAKLKRILLGYARYNPEVGYCQGFNMLGALILQVMEKEEAESMKVMIYLVEGVLPPGYFHGSMGGLQADMAVFRELMQTKLPRLAKHLQKLQGPSENAFEPPLTNVFTMQWFLTMFCTCLPMSCVLRVWDLVLIEGSDVLLRTALVLWSLLEDRVLSTRTADDFYGKMGSFSSELLNGHLIDSNGLIEKVVQLGPIPDIQKLRDKHLYNITPLHHKQGLQFYYDDEEPGSDEESRLAVATVWGIPWGRRGSQGQTANAAKQVTENKERLALDISLLKKQYDRLRERQRQAHIILTTACSTARQSAIATTSTQSNQSVTMNQLLLGRPAIITNKGRRPPPGAIPPARKPSLPTVLHSRPPERQLRRGETLHWRDADISKRRRDSLTWKEIKADRATLLRDGVEAVPKSQKLRSRIGKSDSSSYSEESEDDDEEGGSSTDTSLCDEDDPNSGADKTHSSSIENSPKRRAKSSRKAKELSTKLEALNEPSDSEKERKRPKSWAPSSTEIPFMLMTSDSPTYSGDEQKTARSHHFEELIKEEEDSSTECDRLGYKGATASVDWSDTKFSSIAGDLATTKLGALHIQTDVLELPVITSTSQLSPMPDIAAYLNGSNISPLPTPKPLFLDSTNSLGSGDDGEEGKRFAVSDDGVTNQYFERVNSVERPTKLDLFYSLNEEDGIRRDVEEVTDLVEVEKSDRTVDTNTKVVCEKSGAEDGIKELEATDEDSHRRMELLMDYSEKSSAAFIAEATTELSTSLRQDTNKDSHKTADFRNTIHGKAESEEISRDTIRDDNIPGEAAAQFEEHSTKVGERKVYEDKVKAVGPKKSNTLSSAYRKRRDPRRMTLTRSATIEIEERFQALERRMSEDSFRTDKMKTNGENMFVEDSARKIPTSAELDKRLSTLENEINMDAKVKKRFAESSEIRDLSKHKSTELTNSPFTESKHVEDSSKNLNENSKIADLEVKPLDTDISNRIPVIVNSQKTPEDTLPKRASNHIPSTTELEDRYNALERQLSSNGLPSKSSMDLRRDDKANGSKDIPTPPNTPTESRKQHSEKGESQKKLKNEIETDANLDKEQETGETEKPPLRKLPSTAELEDRFNALERRMSTQKSSPRKTKKEPPDEADVEERHGAKKKPKDEDSEVESAIKEKTKNPSDEDIRTEEVKENVLSAEQVELETKRGTTTEEEDAKLNAQSEEESRLEKKNVKRTIDNEAKCSRKHSEDKDKEGSDLERSGHNDNCQVDTRTTTKATKIDAKKATDTNKLEKQSNGREGEHSKAVEESKSEAKNAGKKSPPSTEELEKRFKALEKQMSSASLLSSKEKKSSTESTKTQENRNKDSSHKSADTVQEKKSSTSTETCQTKSEVKESPPKTEKIVEKPNTELSTKSEKAKSKNIEKKKTATQSKEPKAQIQLGQNKDISNSEPTRDVNAIKSFEEKCKQVNRELTKQDGADLEDTQNKVKTPDPKLIEAFNEKCKEVNEALTKTAETIEVQVESGESSKTLNVKSKRRASEPPSTEDLEKRYESLKRRMSTKSIAEKEHNVKVKSETVVEEESHESPEVRVITKEAKRKSSEPPSTEDLESRYEALQRRTSEQNAQRVEKEQETEKREEKATYEKTTKSTNKEKLTNAQDDEQKTAVVDTKVSSNIPIAPPMPLKDSTETPFNDEQHRALIEEFQSKIKVQPNGDNLKPSDINPNRRIIPERQRASPFDGTSEAHANTAFFRSENYEPWYHQSYKMVRRFSDLPSRADLENRLQFLERQLIMKFYKQRCASDSEVASRKQFADLKSQSADDEVPTTSTRAQQQTADDLERRVLALEKQYSENSLKLLEAVRIKEQQAAVETDSPRRLSTETVDATGKELVRYVGELEDSGALKPINISINIKMMLKRNEDTDTSTKPKDNLPTAAELEKRLEVLEQQLKLSRSRREGSIDQSNADAAQELKKSVEISDKAEPKEKANVEVVKETPEIKKVVKEVLNEECKSDSKVAENGNTKKADKKKSQTEANDPEILSNKKDDKEKSQAIASASENVNKKTEDREKGQVKTDASKAEKTLENQQIARSNKECIDNKGKPNDKDTSNTNSIPQQVDEHIDNKTQSLSKEEKPTEEIVREKDVLAKEIQHESSKETEKDKEHSAVQQDFNKEKQDDSKVPKEGIETHEATKCISAPTQTAIQVGTSNPNNKTMVLLLDNEPKAVKVRRLTRANTEELENLFQALEKQLNDRNLIKSEDGKLMRAAKKSDEPTSEECKAITQLSKEIEDFTKSDKSAKEEEITPKKAADVSKTPTEDYDWGTDPVKRHLKRKTAHLPSTKELEARFRSLERQIKLLEDVEKIDVEQRLNEIERKIKMQYSLSHEKDLTKFLELCEGKNLDELPEAISAARDRYQPDEGGATRTPTPKKDRSPYTSPSRNKEKTPYTSPAHTPHESRSPKRHTSPGRVRYEDINASGSKSPKRRASPGHVRYEEPNIPSTEDLEYRFRALELPRSKSRESLNSKSTRNVGESKKSLIHPLEMLLDPSPDEDAIPTTGELEHRIRVLDDKRKTTSPSRRTRSRSPTIEDIKNRKLAEEQQPRTPIHNLEKLVASPTKRELPTADELEARMRALEEEHCFDFKMQKSYQEFNRKLKDAVSPSLSFEEFKTSKSREESPRRGEANRSTTPKSALRDTASSYEDVPYRSTSPKAIRFRDEEADYVPCMPYRPKSRTDIRDVTGRMTLTDSCSSINAIGHTTEGLDEFGSRLMRETSPLQRTGSHTGVPLRTNDNINERLDSIKNTIKSIDTLCEEKPYRKERCQRYIDSLFSDSIHFASKKTSLEDLSRSESRAREYGPSIRVSDHSQRHSDYLYGRTTGSADSIRSTSPLRAASPLHHRSNRDIRREISPRRRREEERAEYESRVRRENMLPNYYLFDNHRDVSSSSLIKFHKVDRQLDTYKYDDRDRSSSRSASRSPLRSPYGSRETMMTTERMLHDNTKASTLQHNTNTNHSCPDNDRYNTKTPNDKNFELDLDRQQAYTMHHHTTDKLLGLDPLKRSITPVYAPGRLDIRHTTVTSTFYDRLLAEKEIERKFSRPSSRSPIVSPSVTSKSYVDLASASAKALYQDKSPTAAVTMRLDRSTGLSSFCNTEKTQHYRNSMTGSYPSSAYSATYQTNLSNSNTTTPKFSTNTDTHTNITTNNCTTATLNSATTTTGNSSTYSYESTKLTRFPRVTEPTNMDLRIQSCDNILMQLKSASITAAGVGYMSNITTTTTTTAITANTTGTPTTTTEITTNYRIGGLSGNTTNYTTNFTSTPATATTITNFSFSSMNITNTPITTTTATVSNLNSKHSFTMLDRSTTTTIPTTTLFSTETATMTTTTTANTYNLYNLTTTTTPTTAMTTTRTTINTTAVGSENTNKFITNNSSPSFLSYNATSGGNLYTSNTPLGMALPTMQPTSVTTTFASLGLYTSNLNSYNNNNNNIGSNNSHLN